MRYIVHQQQMLINIYWCTDHDQRKCTAQVTTNSLDLCTDEKQVVKLYLIPQYLVTLP